MRKKPNKIQYLRDNPNATFAEYFDATGGNKLSYQQNKYKIKTQKEKAVNILENIKPKKTHKEKVKEAWETNLKSKDKQITLLTNEVKSVRNAADEFHKENKALNALVLKLENDIKMYIAIISYLEHKLGFEDAA